MVPAPHRSQVAGNAHYHQSASARVPGGGYHDHRGLFLPRLPFPTWCASAVYLHPYYGLPDSGRGRGRHGRRGHRILNLCCASMLVRKQCDRLSNSVARSHSSKQQTRLPRSPHSACFDWCCLAMRRRTSRPSPGHGRHPVRTCGLLSRKQRIYGRIYGGARPSSSSCCGGRCWRRNGPRPRCP